MAVTTGTYATEGVTTTHAAHVADDDRHLRGAKKISWGAILAGVVVALVVQLLLNIVGVGVGLGAVDPAAYQTPDAGNFSMSAGGWWALSGIIASFVGGLVAGRLSGRPDASTAGWHGFTAWAATTLAIVYLLSSAVGGLVGGAANMLGQGISGLGQAASAAAPAVGQALQGATGGLDSALDDLTGVATNDPAAVRRQLANEVRKIATAQGPELDAAKQRAAELVARSTNVSVEDARTRIDELERSYKETTASAERTAREAASATAKTGSTVALFSAGALALGALAGLLGGRAGTPAPAHHTTVRRDVYRDERSDRLR